MPAEGSPSPRSVRILVPVDFSKPSQGALAAAAAFARRYGGRITLLTVVELPPLPQLLVEVDLANLPIHAAPVKSRLLALGRRHVDPAHLETAVVKFGRPFEEILSTARLLRMDLIIMATQGHTGVKRVMLGSTAERVVRLAPCPVLTVRADLKPRWP
jgi:nucleotide-binding universal stress UspA family protein